MPNGQHTGSGPPWLLKTLGGAVIALLSFIFGSYSTQWNLRSIVVDTATSAIEAELRERAPTFTRAGMWYEDRPEIKAQLKSLEDRVGVLSERMVEYHGRRRAEPGNGGGSK